MMRTVKVGRILALLAGLVMLGGIGNASPLKTHHTYVLQAQHQLDALSAKIGQCEKKLDRVDAQARVECEKSLQSLRKKERLARARLEEIRNAEASEWQKLRKQEDVLLVSLQKSYTHLKNEYFRTVSFS